MTERTFPFKKSILWKLSVFLIFAIFLTGLIQLYFSTRAWRGLIEEVEQQSSWNVAGEFALRVQPLVKDHWDQDAVEHLLFTLTVLHPRMELYIIDAEGKVLLSIPFSEGLHLKSIDLGPIRRALDPIAPSLPLYGDDPTNEGHQKIFSVAPLVIEGKPGYLYVTLLSHSYEVFIRKTGQFYLLRTILLGVCISICVAFLVGYLFSTHFRQRLKAMNKAIAAFQQGDYSQRAVAGDEDEIGTLSKAFNTMADTIVSNVDELKRKDRLRRELIANISHDLRGPVTSVLGYLETLLEYPTSEEERVKFLTIAYENAVTQQQMVDDLFHLASLEAKESKARRDFCALESIVESTVQSLLPSLGKKQLSIHKEVPKDLPRVYVDAAMIQRVLQNLLSNSIRYTPPGGKITIRVDVLADALKCSVIDTGIGIPEHDIPHIFDSFYRANRHRPEDPGGTGLGLAIVRNLLALHQSVPSVESVLGEGTTISFSLPTKEGE